MYMEKAEFGEGQEAIQGVLDGQRLLVVQKLDGVRVLCTLQQKY